MFSMCSELTPRARIPDTRIPQLMQPCRSWWGGTALWQLIAHGEQLVDIFTDQAPPSQTWQVLLFIIALNLKCQNVFEMTRWT